MANCMSATLCLFNMWAILTREHPREFTASSCCFITHMPLLLFKSQTTKKRWVARIPRGQKYISFNQQRKTERQRALEQIHIVSSHRELGDRKKVSFHGKFPDYYSSSPSALFPHQLPWFHTGQRWKTKTKTHLRYTFEVFNFTRIFTLICIIIFANLFLVIYNLLSYTIYWTVGKLVNPCSNK